MDLIIQCTVEGRGPYRGAIYVQSPKHNALCLWRQVGTSSSEAAAFREAAKALPYAVEILTRYDSEFLYMKGWD
jgi:hypothetical protein